MQHSCSELGVFLCKSLCKHSAQFHICGSLDPPHPIFKNKLSQSLILIINIPSYISPKFSMVLSLIKAGFSTII